MSRQWNEFSGVRGMIVQRRRAAREGGLIDDGQLIARLGALREEHRDLDTAIRALAEGGPADQMQLARLKKRKLRLRDEIAAIEDQLIPDIIA